MMETFIERVAKDILNQQQDPSQTLLIIPNNRAALFLKNALVQNSKKSVILPKIITISEFISRLSGVQVANKTDLLFDFYNCFRASKIEGQSQSFLEFYKWGKVVLSDFNEIDNHLINPDKIFTHINATYALEAWSPDSSALTDFQKKYINLWANLRLLYEKFKNRLIATGKGYSGLVKKIALQRIESGIWDLPYTFDHLHFIGFSALSESEKQIIQNAILQKGACVHWDTDSYYIDNPNNEAGLFLRRYKKDKTLSSTFSESENYLLQNEKNIRILKCQTNVVQVEILNEILKKNQARNTAVVLCDEQLIVPVLNAIPKNQTDINVTLGFPVNVTSVFSHWLEFIRFQCEPGKFEKSKLRLLSENWVWHSLDSQKDLNDDSISDGFAHNLQISEPLLKEYMAVKSKDLPNLIRILVEIAKSILKKENDNDPEDFNTQINKLFHQKLIIILKKLGSMIEAHEVDLEHSEMLFIFKQLMKDEKIDIVGQPTRGIQIMGVLETRVLDFDHLIMLSMNEGDLPKGNNENSIIPLDLKKAYQLPTYSDKDGIFAYHFYRLLQRASHVDLLYS
ncbi:MAG: hypothetical protein MRY83_08695, partial [Flavobacteriales bacterium]|nr:hypothetical protein [Flavobacteriales bacterium]